MVASVVVLALVYAGVQSLLCGGIGQAVFRTGDETGYIDTLTRMHRGVGDLDIAYALSGTTFAYGRLYFFVTAAVTALPEALGIEPAFIFFMRFTNTLLFAGVAWGMAAVLRRFWADGGVGEAGSRVAAARSWGVPLGAWLLVCTFPCLHTVLLLVKPEMLQALLLVLAVLALWGWHESHGGWRLALAGGLFGLCIAAKVSGVLFMAVPIAYFGWRSLRGDTPARCAVRLLCVSSCATLAALVFTEPKVWLFPSTGAAGFAEEFRLYAGGLSASAIAEVDRFTPLESRAGVARAWLTHPYSHGFVCFAAFYVLAAGGAAWAWTRERRSDGFPVVTLALVAHFVCVGYFLVTTTRVTSWYFFPSLLLLVPLAVCALARLLPARRAVVVGLAALAVVQGVFNLRHAAGIVDGVAVARAELFRREAPHFEGATAFLRGAKVPLGQVFVSIDAPLDVTREELRFWPARFDDTVRDGPHHVNRYGTFQRYEVGTLVPERPDVVVFNNTHPQFAQRFELVGSEFQVAYEDEYATILTRHRIARRTPPATALAAASAWSPPGVSAVDTGRGAPQLALKWDKAEWRGATREFSPPLDLPLAVVVLDIEVLAPEDRTQDSSLRLIFGGVHGNDPAYGKEVRAAWAAELLTRVSPGRQRIRVKASEFRRSVGEFQWGYVRTMGFGGVLSPGTEVRLRSVEFEVDSAAWFAPGGER